MSPGLIGAALLLALQGAAPPGYDALVKEGVARSRAGDAAGAEAALQSARSLAPRRPEALVELAGLRFLDGRYGEAAALLRPAVRAGADALAVDLLASSLHLSGRADEALAAWNRLRRPVLRNVRVVGVFDTRSRLLVPQIALVEGAVLTRDAVRETRLRLQETGAFDRVRVRTIPLGGSEADAEVVVAERHGLGDPAAFAALTLSKALQRTAWLQWQNAGGAGLALTGAYRWRASERLGLVRLSWPRPMGLDATLLAEGWWQGQDYAFGTDRLRLDGRGAEVGLRRVLGPRTVGAAGWRVGRRTFAGAAEDAARDGRLSGPFVQVEHRLADGWRHRLDATASAFAAGAASGSDLAFASGRVALRDTVWLAAPEHVAIERSVLAAQLVAGALSEGAPLDTFFVPGASSETTLPLRAYRDRRKGVLGRSPIGRSIALLNLEWRRRVIRRGPVQAGLVVFYDAARVGGAVGKPSLETLQDLGLGLRMGLLGVVVRVDCAGSLNGDSNRVFTAGISQAF